MDISKFALKLKTYADEISEIEDNPKRFPNGYTYIDTQGLIDKASQIRITDEDFNEWTKKYILDNDIKEIGHSF